MVASDDGSGRGKILDQMNWHIIGVDPNHFQKSWDDPPSIGVCYFLFGRVSIYEPPIVVVILPVSTESNNFSPKSQL